MKKEKITKQKKKHPVRKAILLTLAGIFCALSLTLGLYLNLSARGRLLLSTFNFATSTLNDKQYLLYDIDIMDLFVNYSNADTAFDGSFHVRKANGLNVSAALSLDGKRSFSKKSLAMDSQINVLFLKVGEMETYAKDQTFYVSVPMLNDLAFSFDTGLNLFPQMPEFTSDINQKWFRNNAANIVRFTQQIKLEELNDDYTNDDTIGFLVTIPQGCGGFIWELIGIDPPKYDVQTKLYIDKNNHYSRIEILSQQFEDLRLVLDGDHLERMTMELSLPENEKATATILRSGDHAHWFDIDGTYLTKEGKTYTGSCALIWKDSEETGFDLEVKNMSISDSDTDIFSGALYCHVEYIDENDDPLSDVDLSAFSPLDWTSLRDDFSDFVKDMIKKINGE